MLCENNIVKHSKLATKLIKENNLNPMEFKNLIEC
jgi:hypothetical protein